MALDGARWHRVSPYLDHALDLTPSERRTWLALLRSEDAGLAEDVERLLECHRELSAVGFLEALSAYGRRLRSPEQGTSKAFNDRAMKEDQ